MSLLGKLVLKMSADSADFESNIKKAKESARDFGDQTKQAGMVAGAALAAAGAAAIAAGTVIVKSNLASIDSLAKTADKIGITTEALAGMRHAADLTGVSQEGFDKSLQKMVRSIGEAQNGIGMARLEFEKMGLSANDLAAMRPEDAFAAIAEATNNMATQSEKAASAAAIFGREGVALLNTMKLGKDGLAETADEAERLGLTLSRVDAAKVEAANDSLTRMKAASAGFGKILTVELAPFITEVAKRLTDAAKESDGFRSEIQWAMEQGVNGAILFGKAMVGIGIAINSVYVEFLDLQATIWETLKASRELNLSMRDGLPEFLGGAGSDGYKEAQRILSEQELILAQIAKDKEAALAKGAEQITQYEELEGKVRAYVAAVKDSAQAAAERVAAAAPGGSEYNNQTDSTGESITAAEAAKYAAKLDALDMYLAEEKQKLFLAMQARAEMVISANEDGYITEQRRNELLEQIAADHEAKITAIMAKGLSDREKFQAKSWQGQVKQVTGSLADMTASVSKENKAMFAINKAASIANAIMNTYQGASLALATYPGPIGWAMAAATIGVGLAQVAQIASTSFGASAAPSVAATGASGTVQTVDPLDSQDQESKTAGNTYNLTVYGSVVDHDAFARETFEAFQRAANDGMDR